MMNESQVQQMKHLDLYQKQTSQSVLLVSLLRMGGNATAVNHIINNVTVDELNEITAFGMSPLKAAIMNFDHNVVSLLITKGAKVTQDHIDFFNKSYQHKISMASLFDKTSSHV